MCIIDTSSLGTALASIWCLIQGALTLDPAAFQALQNAPDNRNIALFILLLAGLSLELGQSVVLFLNKVRPRRFILSLLVGGILFIVSALIWAGSIWLVAGVVFDVYEPFPTVFRTVSLGYAPVVFGFLVLLPFLGEPIARVLYVWTLLAIMTGIIVTFQFTFWQALVCAILGWVILEGLTHFVDKPLQALDTWFWRMTTGTSTRLTIEDLAPQTGGDGDDASSVRGGRS